MKVAILLFLATAAVAFVAAQIDVDYYVNCKPPGPKSFNTLEEAVNQAKKDGFDHNHFYICGINSVPNSLDFTFRAKLFGHVMAGAQRPAIKNTFEQAMLKQYAAAGAVGDDEWTKEANTRKAAMLSLSNTLYGYVEAQLILAPGVRLWFSEGKTQIHHLLIASSGSAPGDEFSVHINHTTTSGIFKSVIGSFDFKKPSAVLYSTGTELKIIDTILGVDRMFVSDKDVQVSNSILALGSALDQSFTFWKSNNASISHSYITGETGAAAQPAVTFAGSKYVKVKSNNWFDSQVRLYGPVTKIDSSAEFGYSF
jgi:hypothetical protein